MFILRASEIPNIAAEDVKDGIELMEASSKQISRSLGAKPLFSRGDLVHTTNFLPMSHITPSNYVSASHSSCPADSASFVSVSPELGLP